MENLVFKSGHAALEYIEKYFDIEPLGTKYAYFGVVEGIAPPEYKNPLFDEDKYVQSISDPNFDFTVNETCCLCNAKINDFKDSHNPWPMEKDPSERCCTKCNIEKVAVARVSGTYNNYPTTILHKKKGFFSSSIKRQLAAALLHPECTKIPNKGDLVLFGPMQTTNEIPTGFILKVSTLELDTTINEFVFK